MINNNLIQVYEEIILTEMALDCIKVIKHGRECPYYLKCDWKAVLRKDSDIQKLYPKLFLDDHLKQTMIISPRFHLTLLKDLIGSIKNVAICPYPF